MWTKVSLCSIDICRSSNCKKGKNQVTLRMKLKHQQWTWCQLKLLNHEKRWEIFRADFPGIFHSFHILCIHIHDELESWELMCVSHFNSRIAKCMKRKERRELQLINSQKCELHKIRFILNWQMTEKAPKQEKHNFSYEIPQLKSCMFFNILVVNLHKLLLHLPPFCTLLTMSGISLNFIY